MVNDLTTAVICYLFMYTLLYVYKWITDENESLILYLDRSVGSDCIFLSFIKKYRCPNVS